MIALARTICLLVLLAFMTLAPRQFPATAMGRTDTLDAPTTVRETGQQVRDKTGEAAPAENPPPLDPAPAPRPAHDAAANASVNSTSPGAVPEPVWRQRPSQDLPLGSNLQREEPISAPSTETPLPATAKTASDRQRLFQTAAFRGNFDALPKWKRVLSKVGNEIRILGSCQAPSPCPPGATSWQRIMGQARGQDPASQLKMINSFFNKWPYRLDQDVYGVSDWWATPQEFLKLSGDCEDYAIIKYFALRELDFSENDLRIVVLKDRIRGIGHAVLVVFLHGEAFVLDNLTDAIFGHGKYRHYVPQYSLNEKHRWSHIPLANQP